MKKINALLITLFISAPLYACPHQTAQEDYFLHTCLTGDNMEYMVDYYRSGGNTAITDTLTGDNGLIIAAREGHFNLVDFFIGFGEINLNATNKHLKTALMEATYHGHTDIALFLINHGAQMDTQDGRGYTALMWAAYAGHYDVVKELLEIGANAHIRDHGYYSMECQTARDLARVHRHPEIVMLLDEYDTYDPSYSYLKKKIENLELRIENIEKP